MGAVFEVYLLLLGIHRMLFSNWVELGGFVLLAGVFFVFVIKTRVVHVTFTDPIGVAFCY